MEDAATRPQAMGSSVATTRRRASARGIGADLAGVALLVVVACALASAVNLLRAQRLPWVYESRAQTLGQEVARLEDGFHPVTADTSPRNLPHEIRLEEFQNFVAGRKGWVLDARPAVFYREAHVPGALSLPREAFGEAYPALRPTLEPAKDRPVAIYCSGADCPDSQLLSEALTRLGYRHLLIYTSGWEEWSQTGLPQEGTSAAP